MKGLSAEWTFQSGTTDQKWERCNVNRAIVAQFYNNRNTFLLQMVTMNKTPLYPYDSEFKDQLKEL